MERRQKEGKGERYKKRGEGSRKYGKTENEQQEVNN
jgi:hypothetical protein